MVPEDVHICCGMPLQGIPDPVTCSAPYSRGQQLPPDTTHAFSRQSRPTTTSTGRDSSSDRHSHASLAVKPMPLMTPGRPNLKSTRHIWSRACGKTVAHLLVYSRDFWIADSHRLGLFLEPEGEHLPRRCTPCNEHSNPRFRATGPTGPE